MMRLYRGPVMPPTSLYQIIANWSNFLGLNDASFFQDDPADGLGRELHLAEEPGHQSGAPGPQGARILRPRQTPAQGQFCQSGLLAASYKVGRLAL